MCRARCRNVYTKKRVYKRLFFSHSDALVFVYSDTRKYGSPCVYTLLLWLSWLLYGERSLYRCTCSDPNVPRCAMRTTYTGGSFFFFSQPVCIWKRFRNALIAAPTRDVYEIFLKLKRDLVGWPSGSDVFRVFLVRTSRASCSRRTLVNDKYDDRLDLVYFYFLFHKTRQPTFFFSYARSPTERWQYYTFLDELLLQFPLAQPAAIHSPIIYILRVLNVTKKI